MAQLKNSICALFCGLCVLVPLTFATTRDFNYCDKKTNYSVKVSEVDISPFPISRGVDTSFAITAATVEAISGGTLKIEVSYFGINVHSETHDLCKETVCPIPSGTFTLTNKRALPGIAPPGSYTLKMTLTGENKVQLTCVTFDFSLRFIAAGGLVEA